jgi:hypothetical protein
MKCSSEDTASALVKQMPLGILRADVADSKKDIAWCKKMLGTEHSLGAGVAVGKRLWQIVRRSCDDAPVAILLWAASALHLRDRDVWIGWDAMLRSRRLGLIVNNSRLLLLDAQRAPNLATQALGAALRALPGQWAQKHGFAPVLAEAFTDLETHHGTTYKASNWTPLGTSKGYERHRAEFYVLHARPKKLWVYPLCKGGAEAAKALLCAQGLPPEFEKGQIPAVVRCPLQVKQILSLRDVFCELDDPRRMSSRRYRLSTMLTLVCMSLLCGARTLADIVRSCQLLGQRERATLELRRVKGSETLRVPCYNAFRELLPMLDLEQLLTLLTGWLTQHEGTLARTLALDGKDLGKQLGTLVSLINTTAAKQTEDPELDPGLAHDGTSTPPVAMAVADGKGHELKAAQALLAREDVDLRGAVVTADALHAQHQTLHTIVAEKGGDYLVSLKDNQKAAHQYASGLLEKAAPLLN